MNTKIFSLILISQFLFSASFCQTKNDASKESKYEISKTENEWKAILSPEEFEVLRNKGTEYAFTGEYNDFKEKGIFTCAACGNELFDSKTKYDSGSGWPAFYNSINPNAVKLVKDNSFGYPVYEVLCAKCGGHLGHVFEDGPQPTGKRYCVNSVSLDFEAK